MPLVITQRSILLWLGRHGKARREQGKSFRDLPQKEMVTRLRTDFDKMMGIFESLTAEDWTGLMVPHFYMGPVPAFFYPAFQLMDYGIHSWDIREGTGREHGLHSDVADLLTPFMFGIWAGTMRATQTSSRSISAYASQPDPTLVTTGSPCRQTA